MNLVMNFSTPLEVTTSKTPRQFEPVENIVLLSKIFSAAFISPCSIYSAQSDG